MADEKKIETATEKDAETENPQTSAEQDAGQAPEAAGEPEVKEPDAEEKTGKKDKKSKKDEKKELAETKKQLEEIQKKLTESDDKYMRVAAEYDNFRKRSAKELETRYADAYADALTQLLPVIDNIERASSYQESDKVVEGIALILKNFPETLSKLGVEMFGEAGEVFDPTLHNAVMHVEDEEKQEGEIVAVLQRGYRRGDKIIRYAMVTVAN